MSKPLVKDTNIVGAPNYCWKGHPMMIRKSLPTFDMETGEITGYTHDVTCSKPLWKCICRYGIWRGYSDKPVAPTQLKEVEEKS